MTDITTMHLKQLLDEAAPGPWGYFPGDGPDERYIGDPDIWGMCIGVDANGEGSSCGDADLTLAAAAPELAAEVLRLRDGIETIRRRCANLTKNAQTASSHTLAREMGINAKALAGLLQGHKGHTE